MLLFVYPLVLDLPLKLLDSCKFLEEKGTWAAAASKVDLSEPHSRACGHLPRVLRLLFKIMFHWHFLIVIYLFIFLATLRSRLVRHVVLIPWLGIKPAPLNWKCHILITGPPGRSPPLLFWVAKVGVIATVCSVSQGLWPCNVRIIILIFRWPGVKPTEARRLPKAPQFLRWSHS